MKRRLLIVACSAAKDPAPGLIPAIDRYRGAYYQMIHQVAEEDRPEIVILSAEHGFIPAATMIEDYNRRMTPERAAEILGAARGSVKLFHSLDHCFYDDVMIAGGKDYRELARQALDQLVEVGFLYTAERRETTGGIGEQRSQLKAWLAKRGK